MNTKSLGFSIIEIVIGILIIVLLLGITVLIYISYNRLYAQEAGNADVQIHNSLIMKMITDEIRTAKKIEASRTINGTLFTIGPTTLVLAYPVYDANNILVNGVSDFGAFFLDPSDNTKINFSFEKDPSSQKNSFKKNVGRHVMNIVFRYNSSTPDAATNITVFLKTQTVGTYSSEEVIETNTVSLRNK